jgi:hypothetical protein
MMDSFGGSLEQLSSQLDGLILQGVVQRPDFEAMRDQLALSMRTDEVAVFYREMMQQISSIQEIPAIEHGLALAVTSVQTLQSLGQIEDSTRIAISNEVQGIRLELDQQLQALSELREQIRQQAVSSETLPDQATQERWITSREQLSLSLQALQARMNEQSVLLKNEREKAEQQSREQAQRALEIFQGRLFELLCDYSAGLRGLSANESVNVVLLGAGDAMADASRRDIVFSIDRESLLSCQQGRSTPQELQMAAIHYQY